MGDSHSKPSREDYFNPGITVVIFGLDAAGKSTLIDKLRILKSCVWYISKRQCRCHAEHVYYKDFHFIVCDLNSRKHQGYRWCRHCKEPKGMIFIVDSMDRDRVLEARDALHKILHEEMELNFVDLLVLANKKDLPNAMTTEEVTEKLALHSIDLQSWYVKSTCAISGEGLLEGLGWFFKNIKDGLAPIKKAPCS